MTDANGLDAVLSNAWVDDEVFALRPDYRAVLLAVDGLECGPSDAGDARLIQAAEDAAREAISGTTVEQLPHVAAWREAYRTFGAKPQRTRNSVEALMRRAEAGLPRVNRLTDVYNSISVLYQLPIGGEDLSRYVGAPRLIRSTGSEPFDTAAAGQTVVEHPDPGEVVWCDDAGVTCRRWNWRQSQRTQLRDETTTALFIMDALAPMTDSELGAAASALSEQLHRLGTDVRIASRTLTDTDTRGD